MENESITVNGKTYYAEPLRETISTKITQSAIGKYVIVRSGNEGVNFGKVVEADETGIVLTRARRLYSHKPLDANLAWYEGVAVSGLAKGYKISAPVDKIILEDYSITFCTQASIDSLTAYSPYNPND